MARKTAIRISNAELAAEQYRKDARIDRAADDKRQPTTLDLMRAARNQMDETELLKLARSAARLELRGADYDAEDRADCSAELVWHVLAETGGAPPRRDSEHARLSYLCGLARNWRAALIRRRKAEKRAAEAAEDAYAQSPAAMLEAIDRVSFTPAYLAAAARQHSEVAAEASDAIVRRLGFHPGGPVYAAVYQWARGTTGAQCAAEHDVPAGTWKKRAQRGADMLRVAFPDGAELLDALTDGASILRADGVLWSSEDASREASRTSSGGNAARIRWQTSREGTDGGNAPRRAETSAEARELCLMRHQCPVPGLEAIGRSRIRRGYIVHAPEVAGGFYRVPGRGSDQARADSLSRQARYHAQTSRRERGVSPVKVETVAL